MSTPFFLIDFENVQPKALDRLKPGSARIKVFLGAHQTKLMLELVQALQPFGNDAEYIQITGSGPDAVDFHIAFYIGRLALSEPGATFNIISKDRGFDPLVKHLHTLGIGCERHAEIPAHVTASVPVAPLSKPKATKAPAVKVTKQATVAQPAKKPAVVKKPAVAKQAAGTPTSTSNRAALVVTRLQKTTKPATLTKLRSSIKALFKPPLDDKAVDAVIQSLRSSKKIAIDGTKVAYTL